MSKLNRKTSVFLFSVYYVFPRIQLFPAGCIIDYSMFSFILFFSFRKKMHSCDWWWVHIAYLSVCVFVCFWSAICMAPCVHCPWAFWYFWFIFYLFYFEYKFYVISYSFTWISENPIAIIFILLSFISL